MAAGTQAPLARGCEDRIAHLVAQHDRELRIVERFPKDNPHARGDRLACLYRHDPLGGAVLEPHVDDRRRPDPRLICLIGARHRQASEVHLVVAPSHGLRLSQLEHAVALEPHRAIAEALDRPHVMRDEQNRSPLAPEPPERVEALLLERGIAHGEHLVDQQHIGVDPDRDRERQSHEHPGRVVLELQIQVIPELRERDDLVEAVARLPAAEPEHDRVTVRVSRPPPSRPSRSPRGTSTACSYRCRCGRRFRRILSRRLRT